MQSILRPWLCGCICVFFAFDLARQASAQPATNHRTAPKSLASPSPPLEFTLPQPASVATLSENDIKGFSQDSPALQNLIRKSLELTRQNLTYQFGSADPTSGGMDCSGAVFYVLNELGLKGVPRSSDQMCRWVMRHSELYRTENVSKFSDPPFSALEPGDLVFWTGTYTTSAEHSFFMTHVMIYLGKRQKDDKPLLFGASEGRAFDGIRRNGVSVFDFKVPPPGAKGAIFGYGRVPGLKLEEVRKAELP